MTIYNSTVLRKFLRGRTEEILWDTSDTVCLVKMGNFRTPVPCIFIDTYCILFLLCIYLVRHQAINTVAFTVEPKLS